MPNKFMIGDKTFDFVNTLFLVLVTVIVFYPLYFIVIASVSSPDVVNSGKMMLWPVGFSFIGYESILQNASIWLGYRNTIFYTVCGTAINVIFTLLAGYSLSRKDLLGRNLIMGLLVFTMYFQGGLIPLFLQVKALGLYNSPLVMITLNAVTVFNIIITRSFFQSTISNELLEAAFIDGCTNETFFFKIVFPLSKAVTAILILYYGIAHWNSFFPALIFLSNRKLYPLQLILRDILMQSQSATDLMTDIESIGLREKLAEVIKYSVIIVASIPVLILYPLVQKHFVKGVMIGSIKG